tara:strand:- start:211 stop:1365 length:1155 start_codon:yes stop_codon:yes gene_type:complete
MLLRFNIILLSIFLTSCASESLVQTEQEISSVRQEAINSDKSPENLLVEYESKLLALGEEPLSFYAPLNFQQASERVAKAKKQFNKSTSDSIKNSKFELISALRNLDKAASNKHAVKLHLKTADTHFAELITLQTPTLLPVDFAKIQHKFSNLIKLIENGKIQEAIKQEPDFIKDMIQIEIEALKASHLGQSVTYIKQAKENDADDYAPASLKEAENLLHLTQDFIQKSYRDRHAISEKSEATLKSAKKLYFISKESLAIHKNTNEEIENKIISSYAFLRELETSLSIKPIQISEYSEHRDELLKQIKSKQLEAKIAIDALQTREKEAPQKIIPVISSKPTPQIIMSQETNKAVLPELFMQNSYSDTNDIEEENLEFDAIEIVK